MRFDAVIVGAGPVGSALAVSLGRQKKKIMIIDANSISKPKVESKKLAISYGSKVILENLGIWENLEQCTPIKKVHVSHKGFFGRTTVSHEVLDIPALGYVIPQNLLQRQLALEAGKLGVEILEKCLVTDVSVKGDKALINCNQNKKTFEIDSNLAVIADGGSSLANNSIKKFKEKSFHQEAIICTVKCDRKHRNTAYERFTEHGPIALLPFGDEYVLVWTGQAADCEERYAANTEIFLQSLQKHFGRRAGIFQSVKEKKRVPLFMRYAKDVISDRLVVLGNAAQTLHPVAAQGFNLGLRDVKDFADLSKKNQCADLGAAEFLVKYKASRTTDRSFGIGFTDLLTKVFSNNDTPLVITRGFALFMLDALPYLKKIVMQRMIFGSKFT